MVEQGFVVGDLFAGEAVHVLAGLVGLVPVNKPVEGVSEVEAGSPAEFGAGSAGVELEVAGFVDAGVAILEPGRAVGLALTPGGDHAVGDPLDGAGVVVGGAEVEGGGVAGGVSGEELFGERDVAVQGLEDVLPGADGVGAADGDGCAGEEAADEVGDEAIERPVAAADDVAGAGGGDGYAVVGEFSTGK